MKKIIIAAVILSFFISGCGNSTKTSKSSNSTNKTVADTSSQAKLEKTNISEVNTATNGKNYPVATITLKTGEVMQVELNPEQAPNTVNNFIDLANSGFYNGLIFHRVIAGFMDQAGDPNGDGTGGPGYTISGEFTDNSSKNSLKNTLGTIAMARTSDPNSAGSQFYINVANNANLDGQYAVFGKVIKGYGVAVAISKVKTDPNTNKPTDNVTIKSITVDTKGVKYQKPVKEK